ncbi:protease complex subunit PrcB family protein [Flavobacterium sp. UBA6135]|uniref:protease complex subunit PrcB family protein n=1 Tax=Flavobacterium sp. UBA6135 TaxID=1946553 RepID=UPI0025B7CD45|nr:protease complex subunit PrcB family protein [Flavobacterium sp. UBA6135]
MKKILLPLVGLLLFSCSTKNKLENKEAFQLFEILKQDEQGGANIQFFEIITEPNEFKMLLNDKELRNKITSEDIKTSNFLLLNMGEKNSGGHFITLESVEETETEIIVAVKENYPSGMATSVMTYPLTVVKINSKKPIRFK